MRDSPRDAVIVSTCRTPIGKIRGALSSFRPDDLLALTLREAARRSNAPDSLFDEVFAGCANQAGEDNRNVARMATLLAGFPETLPGVTVNRLCASGLEAVVQATRSIWTQDNNCVLAGGVESMTRAPWVMGKPQEAFASGAPPVFDTSLGWRFPNPQMAKRFPLETMGETAENIAERFSISRADQDRFAMQSHAKAVLAHKEGYFKPEILPLTMTATKSREATIIDKDEGPREDTTLEKLSTLKPAFRDGGSVTAGNSSSLNDGAAALVLCSREFAQSQGYKPLAIIRGMASAGVSPEVMGTGPIPATEKVLLKLKLSASDIDFFEINEAFAVQVLAVMRALQLSEDKVNVFGGAIALGHPLGCSGARILTTLLNVLNRNNGTLGVATMCVGVGQGLSVVIERQ